MTLNAYVDDSASREGGREFVLAGYFASQQQWTLFCDDWRKVLRQSPAIEYFHAIEAESLKEQFRGWTEEERDGKVMALAGVIHRHPLYSFECRMDQASFEAILLPVSPYDLRSPYFMLFQLVIGVVVRHLELLGIVNPVEFIFDNQGQVGANALLWYGPFKAMQPPSWRRLLGSPPIFRSDREVLPLQAADCLAWHLRRSREDRCKGEDRPALALIKKDIHLSSWIPEQLLRDMAEKFSQYVLPGNRLLKSTSVVQPMKQLASEISRLPANGQDAAYQAFNTEMKRLQNVPASLFRDFEEAFKQKRANEKAQKRRIYEQKERGDQEIP